jgi:hypothetical protein
MIERLNQNNLFEVTSFLKETKDKYQEFYITIDKKRIFLVNSEKYTKKILKYQECFGSIEKVLQGIIVLYKERGFRPYIKILAKNKEVENKLLKYLLWNYGQLDLYLKVKKINGINKVAQKMGFIFSGDRGQEILLFRKGIKKIDKKEAKNDFDN